MLLWNKKHFLPPSWYHIKGLSEARSIPTWSIYWSLFSNWLGCTLLLPFLRSTLSTDIQGAHLEPFSVKHILSCCMQFCIILYCIHSAGGSGQAARSSYIETYHSGHKQCLTSTLQWKCTVSAANDIATSALLNKPVTFDWLFFFWWKMMFGSWFAVMLSPLHCKSCERLEGWLHLAYNKLLLMLVWKVLYYVHQMRCCHRGGTSATHKRCLDPTLFIHAPPLPSGK